MENVRTPSIEIVDMTPYNIMTAFNKKIVYGITNVDLLLGETVLLGRNELTGKLEVKNEKA